MKLVSWNVNGIRAAWSHGLSDFLDHCDADIYCFQETKTDEGVPMIELDGYHAYWSFCTWRKGYSGTLCLSKQKPLHVSYGFENEYFDAEGRIITLEYPDFILVNCYVPNSQRSKYRLDYRLEWDALLLDHLKDLSHRKPTIVCGDFNVPISDSDIYEENKWVELNAEGFQSEERENLLQIINSGFTDSFRWKHPSDTGKYTWWSNRLDKRKENRGWRLDYFLVADSLRDCITDSYMLSDVRGSDHCPIALEIVLPGEEEPQQQLPQGRLTYSYQDLAWLKTNHHTLDSIKRTDMTNLWETIDWETAEANLATMQMALAKSAYTHDWDLIAKWQKKIVYSLDAKVLAVRHVCETASSTGIDCIKWKTAHEKMSAALSLTSKGYHAMPSRLLIIRTKNGKQRRVHIETYHDRAMQTLYAYALDPVAESWGDRKSFSYRKGRSAYDLNEYVRIGLSGYDAPEWVFIGDVHRCYENISHEWIMRHIPMAEGVLREFLSAGYIFAGELFPTDVGVGVGCALSPIIANMSLNGLQEFIFDHLYPNGMERDYANGNLIRYSDDLIVMARDEETALRIKRYVSEFLDERGLELSPNKTRIINIHDGFEYMSRFYYKRGEQVFCRPSDRAIERFMDSMKELISGYAGSQKSLIEKINKKIDGFVSYHKVGEADEAFRQLDVYIKAMLLQLCESKHPKWTREKILEKYWYMDAAGRYCYALPNKREVRVKFLADTLCVDYFPVKTNVNPYIDIDYVESRSENRKISNATGVYRAIWNRQEGKCYYCGRRILRDEEKTLVEVDASQTKMVARNAYVHKRCLDCSVDFIDTDQPPSSITDIMELLKTLDGSKRPIGQKYLALSEFFRTCDKNSVTLTFKDIEGFLGEPLGATALRKEFWYRTGFTCISQCWLDNGYEIKTLHLEERKRVVFHLTSQSKNTSSVDIPPAIKYGRVPLQAKYELENYFQYIIKRYGL